MCFCAVEPKAGRHFTLATPNPLRATTCSGSGNHHPPAILAPTTISYDHGQPEYPPSEKRSQIILGRRKGTLLWSRLTVHYTPKHGSWLNQARNRDQSLPPGSASTDDESRVSRCCSRNPRHGTPGQTGTRVTINWQFTRKKARIKFGYKRSKRNRFTRSKYLALTSMAKTVPL